MAVDLPVVLRNVRLIPTVVLVVSVAVAMKLVERPTHVAPALVHCAIVLGVVGLQLFRQTKSGKPHKVWRDNLWLVFALNTLLVISCGVALFYIVHPWDKAYDDMGFGGWIIGHAIAGALTCLLMAPVWIAFARRNDGPLKKIVPKFYPIMLAFQVLFFGPFGGAFAAFPLGFLWTENLIRARPHGWLRHDWLLMWHLIVVCLSALAWAGVELQIQRAKQRR